MAKVEGNLIRKVPKPLGDHSRVGDSFGFASSYNTDLPFPVTVRTWKEAVMYAGANNLLLWAHLRTYDTDNVHRRTATVFNLAKQCEPRYYVKSRRDHLKERVWFEVAREPFNDPRGIGARNRVLAKEVASAGA
jgi:hypothetical protein